VIIMVGTMSAMTAEEINKILDDLIDRVESDDEDSMRVDSEDIDMAIEELKYYTAVINIEDYLKTMNKTWSYISLSYGEIGHDIPRKCYNMPYEFQSVVDAMMTKDTSGEFYHEWDVYSLQRRALTSNDIIIYEDLFTNERKMMCVTCAVWDGIDMYNMQNIGLYDSIQCLFVPNEDLRIVRNVTFERYVNAANVIKRSWRRWQTKKEKAANTIQRAVLHYLYKPDGVMTQRLRESFYSAMTPCY
jgi:hypothetical protein